MDIKTLHNTLHVVCPELAKHSPVSELLHLLFPMAASPPNASLWFWPLFICSYLDIISLGSFLPTHSVQFSCSVVSRLFETPWTAARQASLSITNSQSLLRLMSIELVMPSNYLIPCRPLLLLTSPPTFSLSHTIYFPIYLLYFLSLLLKYIIQGRWKIISVLSIHIPNT